ncbi:MAG TPA: nucleotidyltransferase family protein, partial [Acetobacteraceae bacterium]|nr:nucleotidyltransferase family protein [Acetobacteraceae bacterium]
LLDEGIDWTAFARKAIRHGLAGLAGHVLARAAPARVPDEILDALRTSTEQTRRKNRAVLEELVRSLDALAKIGIEAIAFGNPVLRGQRRADPGLRLFRSLNFLVRDPDMERAIVALRGLGYQRGKHLTDAQLDFIRRLEGHEVLWKQALGIAAGLHTRLTSMNAALAIDDDGLRRRARGTGLNGRILPTLAPEDALLVLAIRDDGHPRRSLGWAWDVADFIRSNPDLDWTAVIERARAQRCLRMLVFATSQASTYLNAAVPDAISALIRADRGVERAVLRNIARWRADEPAGSPKDETLSAEWPLLQDGPMRRTRYAARLLFLPAPKHVARIRLPDRFVSLAAYVPVKIAHDVAILPLWRTYRHLRTHAARLGDVLAGSELAVVVMATSAERRAELRSHQTARADAKQALAADPDDLTAWRSLGDALLGLKRHAQAIACYDKVLAAAPENPLLWRKRATAIAAGGRKTARLAIDEGTLDPQDANAWARRAGFLSASSRFAEAAAASDRALALEPTHLVAARIGIRCRIACCDWCRREDDERRVAEGLRAGLNIITPFNHRAISDSEADNLLAARLWAKRTAQPTRPLWRGEAYRHDRIRLAYLCAEFHDHPTAIHLVGVLEHHDKARFETTAISLGPDSAAQLRRRIETACDRFIDVRALNDTRIAAMMREMELDIAVDLNGQAGAGRPGILACRPAPVQVTYLGNAGTTGAPFIDYFVADRTVIPGGNARHYSEKIAYLPQCYQCNDSRRHLPAAPPSRAAAGLPDNGFVYCCFNNNYKISPPVFDVWMRLLSACPGSVLWLLADDPHAMHNLSREAAARGVAPERLVFALRAPIDGHLARHGLADLFLDTLPTNAHATAADALWVGLPVLTCLGNTFGGRVAASMLRAVELPELVTESLTDYEALALALAHDPARLATIRTKLERNRATTPLFDTARITRDLEAAYTAMWQRQQAGLPPATFCVDGSPPP